MIDLIAHEHIQKIKLKELVSIILISVVTSLLIFLNNYLMNNYFFDPSYIFIVSLALLVLGMNLSVYLIKKVGVSTLFYLIAAILTISITDLGITGWNKILVFAVAGILFGGPFLFLKLHLHYLPLDMIIGTIISTASIPLTAAFLLSSGLASSFPLTLINIILVAAAVGLAASIIAFFIWHSIQETKTIIKLEFYLMR